MSHSSSSSQTTPHPAGHPSSSLVGTSLQIPPTQRTQSSSSTPPTSHQSKSRASTRQSALSGSTTSNWSSTSGTSQSTTRSTLKPYFYPTSGYPVDKDVLQQSYPGNGYPISHLQHSYGYPSHNFPCCEVPGVTDLRSQLFYPSSEFPGGGAFPGAIEQDDGSAPFFSGLEVDQPDPGAPFLGLSVGLPGVAETSSDAIYTPGTFDPHYNSGYPT